MIVANIKDAKRYYGVNKSLKKAFEFLKTLTPNSETVPFEGDGFKCNVSVVTPSASGETKLEAHREYLDIHYCIDGFETIGYAHIDSLEAVADYDAENDYLLLTGDLSKVVLKKGDFCIAFPEDAHAPAMYDGSAENLKKAILKNLRFENGTFTYFKHKDGSLEDRHEALGTAFTVLLDIVDGEDAKLALSGCTFTQYGVPLIYPFYGNGNALHNNATWPFVDTFYLLAMEKAYGETFVNQNIMIMLNASTCGHIYEYRDTNLNHIRGAKAQLWSIAGFVNACVRGGLTELPPEDGIIY